MRQFFQGAARALRNATVPAQRHPLVEMLETRRLLTTWHGTPYNGFAAIPGVDATANGSTTETPDAKVKLPFGTANGYEGEVRYGTDSITVTLSDLPAHSMLRAVLDVSHNDSSLLPSGASDASDGYSVAYAGQTYTSTQGYGGGYENPIP
ncbi:MAG TPA: hypothetical protein VGB55_15925, partial [Tepidisphaeraceae bacterium]